MNQLTRMEVDQSCNRFPISLIRYLRLTHHQLYYFILFFNHFTKANFLFSSALSSALKHSATELELVKLGSHFMPGELLNF
jgi:hypothetical protein